MFYFIRWQLPSDTRMKALADFIFGFNLGFSPVPPLKVIKACRQFQLRCGGELREGAFIFGCKEIDQFMHDTDPA